MNRARLTTEKPNPRSRNLDRLSTLALVDLITSEDLRVAPAVRRCRSSIARAVNLIHRSWSAGGRLFYIGAGTSGRLGVLDASECPPTFSSRPSLVQGVIAGGRRALVRSVEGAEDRPRDGAAALRKRSVSAKDVVVGIAACGLTPFVVGALDHARSVGAKTVFITCAPEVRRSLRADVVINPVVGPEILTGSSRMKAGTATKLVLNTLTTAAMVRSGKTFGNLMVDLRASNLKLADRAQRIVVSVTGLPRPAARSLLARAHGSAKLAILMRLAQLDYPRASRRLALAKGSLRLALDAKKA